MKLTFLGSGDAFGSGGRFNTCFKLDHSGGSVLVDCGASSMIAIRKFDVDPNSIDAILITHLHGDHFGGLPFFLLDAQLVSRRTRPLLLAGPPGFEARLLQAMENFFPGSVDAKRPFDLEIRELPPREAHAIAGLQVWPYTVKHHCGAPPYAYRIEADGKSFCYSGDTEWVDALGEAAAGVDLFVCEAYFFDKKIKWHLDLAAARERAPATGAKRTIYTHHNSDTLARVVETGVETAEDGLVVEF